MDERRYFILKKLHSLSGVVPTAAFLAFHLFENSHSVAGEKAFNDTVALIRSMPYLYLLEIGLIAPIFFHVAFGLMIAKQASYNVASYGFRANWMYVFQRVTGYILFFFIGFHLYNTRFAGIASEQMFQYLAGEYAKPAIFAFYLLGILSAAFHAGNGIWGFLFSWGIVTGQKSQDLAWKACMGFALAVGLMGVNALLGFSGRGVDIFQHEKTQVAAPAAPAK